jgi:hypothetical protein
VCALIVGSAPKMNIVYDRFSPYVWNPGVSYYMFNLGTMSIVGAHTFTASLAKARRPLLRIGAPPLLPRQRRSTLNVAFSGHVVFYIIVIII